jgi:hypothetical protein
MLTRHRTDDLPYVDYAHYRAEATRLRRECRTEITLVSLKFLASLPYRLVTGIVARFQYSGVPGTKASNAAQN